MISGQLLVSICPCCHLLLQHQLCNGMQIDFQGKKVLIRTCIPFPDNALDHCVVQDFAVLMSDGYRGLCIELSLHNNDLDYIDYATQEV